MSRFISRIPIALLSVICLLLYSIVDDIKSQSSSSNHPVQSFELPSKTENSLSSSSDRNFALDNIVDDGNVGGESSDEFDDVDVRPGDNEEDNNEQLDHDYSSLNLKATTSNNKLQRQLPPFKWRNHLFEQRHRRDSKPEIASIETRPRSSQRTVFGIQFAQAQEVAEGLTLAPRTGNSANNHLANGSGASHYQHFGSGINNSNNNNNTNTNEFRWPMGNQLEKIKSETRMSALVGQNAIMNCNVHFKDGIEKPFAVNWLKYPHKLPIYIYYAGYPPHVAHGYENRVTRIGQASLNLSQVQPTDQGLYECKIYYLDGGPREPSSNGTWIYLDVQAPPRFTTTPPNVSYVQAGDSLHLTCQAESTPRPVLRWYKNKTPIDSDSGAYRLSTDLTSGGYSSSKKASTSSAQLDLFIDNVQAGSTTGDYLCLASNSEGSIEARSQVMLAVPAVITTMPQNQTRLEGDRVEFTCQAKALPSNITYKWLFNDKLISGLKQFDSRYSVRRDETLVIHSAHRDDEGEYKCQATNGLAHRSQQPQQKVPVQLAHKQQSKSGAQASVSKSSGKASAPSGEPAAPIYAEASAYLTVEYPARITFSPQVQYLPLGLSGLIRCYVQAAPPVDFYTWTLNNSHFDPIADPNIESLSNGSLLIREVSKKYEGGYRCAPFNKHGSAGSSATMEVRVEEPPKFSMKPAEFYRANVNGHIKIPCDAAVDSPATTSASLIDLAPPKPRVTWRRVVGRPTTLTARVTENKHQNGSSNMSSYQQSPTLSLMVDESEENEDPHLYPKGQFLASGGGISHVSEAESHANLQQQQQIFTPANEQQQEASTEKPSVISYAKLPTDRSEYKNSHLLLHGLRKEDHGIYECVIENEVATLVASTMLYIEETTPHAPSELKVETKSWSALVSWLPGYDGGFEQSFVVWYRRIDKPLESTSESSEILSPTVNQQQNHQEEQMDFNWHSQAVPSGQPSTSYTVQNLTQDTNYEFYVRAKNIIGDGPRSEIVQAATKRAVSGSLTPIGSSVDTAASTILGTTDRDSYNSNAVSPGDGTGNDDSGASSSGSSFATGTETEESESSTMNPSVMGIIHLVDVSTTEESGGGVAISEANASNSDRQSSASTQLNNNFPIQSQQMQQQDEQQESAASKLNSSKVYRIIHPSKQSSNNNSDTSSLSGHNNKKSPRYEPPDSESRSSTSSLVLPPPDPASAPQNVSMVKVAQGWVIEWAEPRRAPMMQRSDSQMEMESEPLAPMSQVNGDAFNQQKQQSSGSKPAGYSVEFKERAASKWNPLATISAKERSMLVKDLRAGGDYLFRVYAHWPGGVRGSASDDFRYQIPDNRRKPTSAQALSAGVVAGILFFIAAIVLAVCFVNMCNKRRKKRAEKAAYVMMACPVLESHHDIAALNSNSLLKNSRGATQNRVPGLGDNDNNDNNDSRSSHYQYVNLAWGKFSRLLSGAFRLSGGQQLSNDVPMSPARQRSPMTDRHIVYSSNAPVPVDVDSSILPYPSEQSAFGSEVRRNQRKTGTVVDIEDDYWVRQPSDRKWGTLTLAATKMAERRAAKTAQAATNLAGQEQARPETADSLADELYVTANEASRTWATALSPAARAYAIQRSTNRWPENNYQSEAMSQQTLPQLHFNAWLSEQLRPQAQRESFVSSSPQPKPVAHQQAPPKATPRTGKDKQQVSGGGDVGGATDERIGEFSRFSVLSHRPPSSLHKKSFSQVNPNMSHLWMFPHQQYNYHNHQTNHLSYGQHSMTLNSRPWFPFLSPQNYPTFTSQFPPIDANDSIANQANSTHQQIQVPPQFQSMLAKRNSIARSTLPLAYNHSLSSPFVAPPQQQPIVSAAFNSDLSENLATESHLLQPPCPFYPPINLCNNKQQQQVDNDDPVTENACLGSYKRKKRLPHIEAQFTITPPELPIGKKSANSAGQSERAHTEQEAVASGRLFVRSLPQRPKTEPPPPPRPPLPRGMPWPPGQRSEQRRLRPPPHLKEVETIGTREKIESYLRHYELSAPEAEQVVESQDEYLNLTNDYGDHDHGAPDNSTQHQNNAHTTPPFSSSPIEVDRVEELTFQPYHNLPHLKYTISLPLSRTSDGTLVLNETSHLRRSKRQSVEGNRLNTLTLRSEVKKSTGEMKSKPRTKTRLGSSSSCPPPPVEFRGNVVQIDTLDSFDRRLSLDSALDLPTIGHANSGVLSRRPADSLELPEDHHRESVEKSTISSCSKASKCPTPSKRFNSSHRSFYLRESDETFDNPEPPPIPPHRVSSTSGHLVPDAIEIHEQQSSGGSGGDGNDDTKEPLSLNSTSSSSNLAASSSSGNGGGDTCTRSSASVNGTLTSNSVNGHAMARSSINVGECSLSSQQTNNDQSLDENYEFDRQSSCSSSHHLNNNAHKKVKTKVAGADIVQSPPRVKISENFYTKVTKAAQNEQPDCQLKNRCRFYDNSMQKQQNLTTMQNRPPSEQQNDETATDFYDTVYESIVHRDDHRE